MRKREGKQEREEGKKGSTGREREQECKIEIGGSGWAERIKVRKTGGRRMGEEGVGSGQRIISR